MAKGKSRSVFERAKEQTSFANIGWEIADVQRFRPQWDEDQCRTFLQTIERQLAVATLMAGWEALDALIQHHERKEQGNDERPDDQ
jgi:hypothetical protein